MTLISMLVVLTSVVLLMSHGGVLGLVRPSAVRRCMADGMSGSILRKTSEPLVIYHAYSGNFIDGGEDNEMSGKLNDGSGKEGDGDGDGDGDGEGGGGESGRRFSRERFAKGHNEDIVFSMDDETRSSGVIFSEDFKQTRRRRGKFVSSRDRRRDRMINSRSRPSGVSKSLEDENGDQVEQQMLSTGSFTGGSVVPITNSVDRSTYEDRSSGKSTASSSSISSSSNPFNSQNAGKRSWATTVTPEEQRRGKAYEPGSARAALPNPNDEPLGSNSAAKGRGHHHFRKDRDGSGSSYTISGKQTTLHANDVYCRFLHYDHLSSHPLDTIEVSSNRIPKHKNVAYVSRWWRGVKRWGLLSEDLESIERAHLDSFAAEDPSASGVPISRDSDKSPAGDGEPSSRRLPRAMYDAIRNHCENYKARVICVGDVHGCADELQDLLRKVNYRPSDVIVLLGDLVAKGPRSSDVIQMAIDLNAISVRGNHDQEVIRRSVTWRSSVKQGRASEKLKYNEHTRIAKELSPAQWTWLTELPYFIRSDDLAALFVHAGFQANLRLTDQDPWVMMTMRSLLPGLRASARCDSRFPWASLWKGPMTVYFGHDAARGLQVYNHAVGLDTGCVYGAELTAMILPNKDLVAVRARKAYQDMRKSRSHKSLAATGPDSNHKKTKSQSHEN